MCLILMAIQSHPVYTLVVAANRDEFYDRPTAPACFWHEHPDILAGKDLRAGGTWLGVTRGGRIAGLTNYRDPASLKAHAPSRGELVSGFLKGEETPEEYLTRLDQRADEYNGFNLVAGTGHRIYWYSNRGGGIRRLAPGIYGISNHLLDTPWPKVVRAKAALKEILAGQPGPLRDLLFQMLSDRTVAEDHVLPHTGVGIQWERILSPVFISSPDYGTRSSTLLLIDRENNVTFVERTYGKGKNTDREVVFEFPIED